MAGRAGLSVITLRDVCRQYESRGLVRYGVRQAFYLETVFRNVQFSGATVLDVGSGIGLASCLAMTKGALRVVALEPEAEGSASGSIKAARELMGLLGLGECITCLAHTVESFSAGNSKFDVILLHDSINHLDERACLKLLEDGEAHDRYLAIFKGLAALMPARGQLFISDCTPRSIFPLLGLRNPFAPTIEWKKHHVPEVWVSLLEEAGFDSPCVSWTPVTRWYRLGRFLTGNELAAFFTTSHFQLTMRRS